MPPEIPQWGGHCCRGQVRSLSSGCSRGGGSCINACGKGRRKVTGPPPLTQIPEVKDRVSSRGSLKTNRHTHALTHRHSQSGRQPPSIRLGPTNSQTADRQETVPEGEGRSDCPLSPMAHISECFKVDRNVYCMGVEEGAPRHCCKHPTLTARAGWSCEDLPLPHPKWFSENFGQWGLAFLCPSLGDAGKGEPLPQAHNLSPSRAP